MAAAKGKLCPHCGAKMVEYTHTLSRGLIGGFYKAVKSAAANGFFEIGKVEGLTYSQRENLRKLQYWSVIRKADETSPKGGEWYITTRGMAFIKGVITLSKKVVTYRGDVVRFEGKQTSIGDVTGGWKYRPDYANEAVPHPAASSPQRDML